MHPYTGCSHKCLYCYAYSYIGFKESSAKKDFIRRLRRDLRFIPRDIIINMSTSSDPYPPIEKKLQLTRKTVEILLLEKRPLLITTKSDIVTRDIDILAKGPVSVMITITTLDNSLAKKLEPGAPSPSARLEAIKILVKNQIPVGVRVDPVIPFLNDDNAVDVVEEVARLGVKFIVTSTYKAKLDNFKRLVEAFPELENKLRTLYYKEGIFINGYKYLPHNVRRQLLLPVIRKARSLGLEYATCREGFTDKLFFNARSCDGSHLINLRVDK